MPRLQFNSRSSHNTLQLVSPTSVITVILAVSLIVAAEAQYHLPPTGPQQGYSYPTQQVNYYQPHGQYEQYRTGPVTQLQQRANQPVLGNEARSSTTFNFGPRRVAVQVNHHASEAVVNNYSGQHGVSGYTFPSQPGSVANQFSQDYSAPAAPAIQNRFTYSNDYNKQTEPVNQGRYTITNPINGEKYSLNQPISPDQNYNLNIDYNAPQNPQSYKQPLAENGFQFTLQPNYLNYQAQQNQQQNGYAIDNGHHGQNAAVYSQPTPASIRYSYTTDSGYSFGRPNRVGGYEVSDPNQPQIHHKLVYAQPSGHNYPDESYSPTGQNENSGTQISHAVPTIAEVPPFESTKLITKHEYQKNYTIITSIDENVEEGSVTTPIPTFGLEESTQVTLSEPVQEHKSSFLPTPTIVQPVSNLLKTRGQYYDSLVNVPDYSALYNAPDQRIQTPNPPQNIPQNYNLVIRPTPNVGSAATFGRNDAVPGSFEGSYIYDQSTPQPIQQNHYVYYQTTPAPESLVTGGQYIGNLPVKQESISPTISPESNIYEQTTQKTESLLTTNTFQQTVSEIVNEESLPNSNGIVLEQFPNSNTEEASIPQVSNFYDQTTPASETIVAVNKFKDIVSGQVSEDSLLNNNAFSLPTLATANKFEGTVTSQFDNIYAQPSPTQQISVDRYEENVSQVVKEETISNQNNFYSPIQSTTPPYEIEVVDQRYVTEAPLSVVSGSTADVQNTFVSTSIDKDVKKVKKVRVFKKPVGLEQPLINERISKNLNAVPILPTLSTGPESFIEQTVIPQRQPGRFQTTNPHRLNNFQRTIPRQRVRPTIPQAMILNVQPTVAPPVTDYFQPTVPPQIYSTIPQQTVNYIQPTVQHSSDDHIQPTAFRQLIRGVQTTFPRQEVQTTVPVQTVDPVQATVSTQQTTRVQTTIQQQSSDYTETTQPQQLDIQPSIAPEQVTLRSRGRLPSQRGYSGSSFGSANQGIYSLNRQNINGRLRVIESPRFVPTRQPDERRNIRYHAVKQTPQRQVIRRVKVKMNRKTETLIEEDQDASGSVKTSFRQNNLSSKYSLGNRDKLLQPTIRKSGLFSTKRADENKFGVSTTTEVTVEGVKNQDAFSGVQSTTTISERVTTERAEIHLESTTGNRVTEKRHIKDGQFMEDVNGNLQSLHQEKQQMTEDHQDAINIPSSQIPFQLQEVSSVMEDEQPEINTDRNIGILTIYVTPQTAEIQDPQSREFQDQIKEEDQSGNIEGTQGPQESYTKIEIVTSVSEMRGTNKNEQTDKINGEMREVTASALLISQDY